MVMAASGRWIEGARKTSTANNEGKAGPGVRLQSRIWRWQCLSTSIGISETCMGAAEDKGEQGQDWPGRVMGLC